jgi:DNA repair exonuclease SbcCD ATPase subunit
VAIDTLNKIIAYYRSERNLDLTLASSEDVQWLSQVTGPKTPLNDFLRQNGYFLTQNGPIVRLNDFMDRPNHILPLLEAEAEFRQTETESCRVLASSYHKEHVTSAEKHLANMEQSLRAAEQTRAAAVIAAQSLIAPHLRQIEVTESAIEALGEREKRLSNLESQIKQKSKIKGWLKGKVKNDLQVSIGRLATQLSAPESTSDDNQNLLDWIGSERNLIADLRLSHPAAIEREKSQIATEEERRDAGLFRLKQTQNAVDSARNHKTAELGKVDSLRSEADKVTGLTTVLSEPLPEVLLANA